MNNVVCGPPGCGKTTFVLKRRSYGDLVVDVDALFHALTGLPYYEKPQHMLGLVLDVRDYLVTNIKPKGNRFYNAWVITGGADPRERHQLASRMKARVYVLDTSISDCLRHIANDPRRAEKVQLWADLVHAWFDKYRPDPRDVVVKVSETRPA